jgi:pimeloyl-ACP methyl ester carboxylesterase
VTSKQINPAPSHVLRCQNPYIRLQIRSKKPRQPTDRGRSCAICIGHSWGRVACLARIASLRNPVQSVISIRRYDIPSFGLRRKIPIRIVLVADRPRFGVCRRKQAREAAVRERSRLLALVYGRQITHRVISVGGLETVCDARARETDALRPRLARRKYLPYLFQLPKSVRDRTALLSCLISRKRPVAIYAGY